MDRVHTKRDWAYQMIGTMSWFHVKFYYDRNFIAAHQNLLHPVYFVHMKYFHSFNFLWGLYSLSPMDSMCIFLIVIDSCVSDILISIMHLRMCIRVFLLCFFFFWFIFSLLVHLSITTMDWIVPKIVVFNVHPRIEWFIASTSTVIKVCSTNVWCSMGNGISLTRCWTQMAQWYNYTISLGSFRLHAVRYGCGVFASIQPDEFFGRLGMLWKRLNKLSWEYDSDSPGITMYWFESITWVFYWLYCMLWERLFAVGLQGLQKRRHVMEIFAWIKQQWEHIHLRLENTMCFRFIDHKLNSNIIISPCIFRKLKMSEWRYYTTINGFWICGCTQQRLSQQHWYIGHVKDRMHATADEPTCSNSICFIWYWQATEQPIQISCAATWGYCYINIFPYVFFSETIYWNRQDSESSDQSWKMYRFILCAYPLNLSLIFFLCPSYFSFLLFSISLRYLSQGPVSFNGADRVGISVFNQVQNGLLKSVALYYPSQLQLEFNCTKCVSIKWKGDQVPIAKRIFKLRVATIAPIAFFIISALSLVGIILSIAFLTFNLHYRKMK